MLGKPAAEPALQGNFLAIFLDREDPFVDDQFAQRLARPLRQRREACHPKLKDRRDLIGGVRLAQLLRKLRLDDASDLRFFPGYFKQGIQ